MREVRRFMVKDTIGRTMVIEQFPDPGTAISAFRTFDGRRVWTHVDGGSRHFQIEDEPGIRWYEIDEATDS